MPELPEVETIVHDLRRTIIDETVEGVDVFWEGAIAVPSAQRFSTELLGRRIRDAERRGKFIILRLEPGDLLVHLRMTGQLLVTPNDHAPQPRHLRVALRLREKTLLFSDMRKFGRMYLVPDANQVLGNLGPEPLDPGFGVDEFQARLNGHRRSIKALLLDQRVLAGLGNIYADEALHAAGIAPQRQACTLDQREVTMLHGAIRDQLQRAIHNRGTTFSDYRDTAGNKGEHHEYLQVYGRAGSACLRCGSTLLRVRICGRSSFYCPICQK